VRAIVLVALAFALATSPFVSPASGSGAFPRSSSKIPSWSAPGSAWVHAAWIRPRALSACSGSACRTAIIPSWFTRVTPGAFSAAVVSAWTSFTPWAGGRRTFAYSIPGRRMSAAYCAAPVTLSLPSIRFGERPIVLNALTERSTTCPSSFRPSAWPFASSA